MRHHNSVFHQLSKLIDWRAFDHAVERHGADHRVRQLTTKSQFLAVLFGQLSGAGSLRQIENGLASHNRLLYHCGACVAARSTLADANAKRPAAVFEEVFAAMMARAARSLRRSMKLPVRLLDATRLPLSMASADWARLYDSQCGAKLHVVYDPDTGAPVRMEVTPANVNDITPAKQAQIEPDTTYVFDMAYYDFQWWADLDAAGCRFVTRLKCHTRLQTIQKSRPVSDPDIRLDQIGMMNQRMARSRRNPLGRPLREIVVRLETGKELRIVTNDLEAPAREIADLYKMRWQIELFFRWIKQNLRIRRFIGTSANAVRIQIAVAMIAFLLLKMAHQTQKAVNELCAFCCLIRLNIMHKKPINRLNEPPKLQPINPNQYQMEGL